jgi:hypothetical protein
MKSITVFGCPNLSGIGLSYLVANKEFLVQIKIHNCGRISSEGYHCMTTLTNLTHLTITVGKLDDIGFNLICSCCLFIEYLDIRYNHRITVEGLNNIHSLIHLKTLLLEGANDNWLAKLSHNITITHLDLSESVIFNGGLSHLSSLVNLTRLILEGCPNTDENFVSTQFAFPISIFF